ncbi:HD domain-containing phosphohydrolase [Clostridium sp.]|uniref:HD domain-containing phosphohydrolase n=1 Tax=Clostridium sp. TaxID=1506 RepID=UPI003D6D6133
MNVQNIIVNLLVNIIPILSIVYIVVGIRLFRQIAKRKENYFSFLMFAFALYSFGYFLELNCEELKTFLLVRNFEFLGSTFIPTLGILFIADLTEIKISKKVKSILFIVSTFLWLLFISDPFHHLIYKSINLRVVGGLGIVDARRGSAFYSMLTYYIVLIIFSTIALTKTYKIVQEPNKKKSLLFLIRSFYIPWVAIIIVSLKFDTYIEPVEVTIMILAGLFAINEIKNNMFEVQIKIWKDTYENSSEPAFLIDKLENVVCSNIIAKNLLYNQGKSIDYIIENLDDSEINRKQVFFKTNSGIKWFDVKKSEFDIKRGFVSYLLIDITEGKLAEGRLKESEEKFSKLFYVNPSACALSDFEDKIYTEVNKAFYDLLGFDKNEVIGKTVLELDIMTTQTRNKILLNIDCNGNATAVEVDLNAKNGDIKHVLLSSEDIYVQDKKYCFTAINDVTEIKHKQEEIEHLSYYDQLTGLYNRRFYEEELMRLDTTRNLPLTIVMGDVNGLKIVNDSFGHVKGDELLKKVAGVIKLGCREDDIIARLGGDEFVIILPKTDGFEADQIIKRINNLSSKEKIESIDISISFGYETKNTEKEKTEEIFKKAEDHMYKKKLFESPSMRGKAIAAIIRTLHEKNKREEQHSHRVSALCESMGEALRLPEYEIKELKNIGLLHDIGKIAIDENILNKAGKLTGVEWNEIKRHPEIGYRILNTVDDMSDMAKYLLHHHERWDGKGYPKGLKGDEIPFVSRIITIADAYDAMTSERSYRSALSNEVAIEELQKNAGTQFDSELVRVFIEKVLDNPNI